MRQMHLQQALIRHISDAVNFYIEVRDRRLSAKELGWAIKLAQQQAMNVLSEFESPIDRELKNPWASPGASLRGTGKLTNLNRYSTYS